MSFNGLYDGTEEGLVQGLYDGTNSGLANGTGTNDIIPIDPSYDVDAIAFIKAHQVNTGQTMGLIQRQAINKRYLRYKNILPTPNGSNLWNKVTSTNSRIWIHCPIDDINANANAYQIEFVSKTPIGTFVGFSNSDFTPQGVTGGTGKYFNSLTIPTSYAQDSVCIGVYSRTQAASTVIDMGSTGAANTNGFYCQLRNGAGNAIYRLNDNTSTTVAITRSDGLIVFDRNGGSKRIYRKGSQVNSNPVASTGRNSVNIYFHAFNSNGTLANESPKQFCSYFVGMPTLTANEHSDLNWIEQLYNTEIITGGRQV